MRWSLTASQPFFSRLQSIPEEPGALLLEVALISGESLSSLKGLKGHGGGGGGSSGKDVGMGVPSSAKNRSDRREAMPSWSYTSFPS
jgi:hypothetical protein